MRIRSIVALALAVGAISATGGQAVFAQRLSNNGYRPPNNVYRQPLPRSAAYARGRTFSAGYAEELPAQEAPSRLVPPQSAPPGNMQSTPFGDDGGPLPEYGPSGECCDNYGCDSYGCDDCCDIPCDSGCCSTCGPDGCCSPGECFITADYLYVRSSFSDSVGFAELDQQGTESTHSITQLDFDYESSFRFGGGYRMCGCGDEIRFLYTRLESSAFLQQESGGDLFVPFYGGLETGEQVFVHADVEVNSYELEYSKTIPLGGGGGGCGCGGCGSACGCGGGCGSCPAWDVSWSGGFRAAEAEWNRAYVVLEDNNEVDGTAVSSMDFEGAGLKVGLEGRRYFFCDGWLSMYAKGNLSLLYGRLHFDTVLTQEGGTAPDQIDRESTTSNQIIPVTELEAGLTGQVSCQCRISAGYLMSAWHDLGFRDEADLNTDRLVLYDDANILGFDGFFARLEYAY
jgi:hypothetical protein